MNVIDCNIDKENALKVIKIKYNYLYKNVVDNYDYYYQKYLNCKIEKEILEFIHNFKDKYPRCCEMVSNLNQSYPFDLKFDIILHTSVLMYKLQNGEYKKYMRIPDKQLPNKVIDSVSVTYIKNFVKVADDVFQALGKYEPFPKLNVLIPENFMKKMVEQNCD